MSTLSQTKSLLEAIRADLKREKETLITLLKDPKIADWQTIDLKKNQPLLAAISVDPGLISAALIEYPKQAKKIAKQLSDWDNEIGNQLADLIGQPDPDPALAKAQLLEERCRGLAAMKEEFQARIRQFLVADQLLRQQLELKPMLTIAKQLTVGKREFFDGGTATLTLLVPCTDTEERTTTIQEIRQEPPKLADRFQRLDVTKLPRLIEEVLFHHIEVAVAATKEIATFLETLSDRLTRELEGVALIEQNLAALQGETAAGLMIGITRQAGMVANLISALYHKRQLKETMNTVTDALDLLNIFHLLLKNKIIPELQKEVGLPGSPLSPITIAAKSTRSFFVGAAGIIRSLKLMMTSLTGKAAINENELQLTLERSIMNCKTFYGNSREDLKRMKLYIDTLVGQYPKPFPYNDLFKLTRTTLTLYGEEVEKFIRNHEIPKEMQNMATATIPTKVGLLTAAIARQKAIFQKANEDN
jgi:uncharacterized small protein (DUF1192 family)